MTRRTGDDRNARPAGDAPSNAPHDAPGLSRLKRRPEFLAVAAARRKWVAPGLVLQARRNDVADEPGDAPRIRFGITASKKVGNAVARNRAKRRLRAAAAEILPVSGAAGYDVVLIARAATLERPYADLKADLAQGLEKLTARPKAVRPLSS